MPYPVTAAYADAAPYAAYKFNVVIYTDDLALLACLRVLSQQAQLTGDDRIPAAGTGCREWVSGRHTVVFRFSSAAYRQDFLALARRLLPKDAWREVPVEQEGAASASFEAAPENVRLNILTD